MRACDVRQFEAEGWLLIADVLTPEVCDELVAALATPDDGRRRGGRRNAFQHPAVVRVAVSAPVRALVDAVLGAPSFAVRALTLDKSPEANWQVPWHRDCQVAVRARIAVPGFDLWTVKDQVHHVEAPRQVMAGMVAARFHLDAVGDDDGPLRILPGSHRDLHEDPTDPACAVAVSAGRGSLLLMRPLLRHASSPVRSLRHRRVVHIEYATQELPGGLQWHERL
jgi:ectoine hydroxylase-related dioxygenase (phytanoyl-CoA dioxygenase family)